MVLINFVWNNTSWKTKRLPWCNLIGIIPLITNDDYAPYDKHLASYELIVAGLPDVTNAFMENVGNIANKILAKNDSTNGLKREPKAVPKTEENPFDFKVIFEVIFGPKKDGLRPAAEHPETSQRSD